MDVFHRRWALLTERALFPQPPLDEQILLETIGDVSKLKISDDKFLLQSFPCAARLDIEHSNVVGSEVLIESRYERRIR